jgi:DNA polymerase III gamma/tau subunit
VDLFQNLKSTAEKKQLRSLNKMFEATIESKTDLKSNLNTQLTLESMLIKFCEAS